MEAAREYGRRYERGLSKNENISTEDINFFRIHVYYLKVKVCFVKFKLAQFYPASRGFTSSKHNKNFIVLSQDYE